MLKKLIGVLLVFVMVLSLCACAGNGDIAHVTVKKVESQIFSEKDINSAIDEVKKLFAEEFGGCSLTEIYYAGDSMKDSFERYKKRYDVDDAIILQSSLYVDSSGGEKALTPDTTYSEYNWILLRDSGSPWRVKKYGY